MRKAVFPGSFDPITLGHYDLVLRALPLFDEIVIAIGHNAQKQYLFSLEERKALLAELFADHPSVKIDSYQGLTAAYCRNNKANFLVRGLRSSSDFDYEKSIAQLNAHLEKNLETVFLISAPQYSHISSSIVREILINSGDASALLPEQIRDTIQQSILSKKLRS